MHCKNNWTLFKILNNCTISNMLGYINNLFLFNCFINFILVITQILLKKWLNKCKLHILLIFMTKQSKIEEQYNEHIVNKKVDEIKIIKTVLII